MDVCVCLAVTLKSGEASLISILRGFMKTRSSLNAICVNTQLSYMQTLESTLNVFMKISSNTSVIFAKRALVIKVHSKCILKGFMKTKSPSNAICVSIQHSKMQTLKNTLIVSMKTQTASM
jgi:hypothetical protein